MGAPTTSEQGGIVALFTGGAILGALSIAYLADKIGRKMTVFIGAVISCLGCALQAGAANVGRDDSWKIHCWYIRWSPVSSCSNVLL